MRQSAILLWVALCCFPAVAGAQGLYEVGGRVRDGQGAVIAHASVRVVSTEWRAITDASGRFVLRLPRGEWQLEVARVGYGSRIMRVRVPSSAMSELDIRLAAEPLALRGITVQARNTPPLGASVTTETVRQVPPLAEPDVFRAVTLLPHVTQPNDLKGRIHLAGGASDETGIRLDGHPLQDPFHLLGVLGAFNVAALERADVLTHHLPARRGGRLSGVLDLRTRRPRSPGEGEGVASLLAAGVTVNRPLPLGLDVLASGRLSYLGGVLTAFAPDAPTYGFRDGLVRLGRHIGAWRAEAVLFGTGDRFEAAPPTERTITWGEALAGVRLERSATRWRVLIRGSFNRSRLDFGSGEVVDTAGFSMTPSPDGAPMMHAVRDRATAAVEVGRVWRIARLTAGAEADVRKSAQRWRAHELVTEVLTPGTPPVFAGRSTQRVVSPYLEGSLAIGQGWSAGLGVRAPVHAGAVTVAPRAVVERDRAGIRMSLALGRRVQFDAQAEEPIEGSITAPLFHLDAPRTADVLGAAVEWPSLNLPAGGSARLRLEAFFKRYTDRPVLRSRGPEESRDEIGGMFPEFERVRGRAYGGSIAAVARIGDLLLQGSYAYQRATAEYQPGEWSPTSWDAPHMVKALASVPLGRGWIANVALRAHSGRAVTPVIARVFEPAGAGQLSSRYLLGDRNSARVPPYRRLDLGVRHGGSMGPLEWTFAAQVLNLLNHTNPVGYDWPQYFARIHEGREPGGHRPGLPFLPSLGLEVRW